ncbi:MAG: alkaline phosphatase family protein [Verrucomicrobiota bacterium]
MKGQKVVLVGWDGADWKVARPLMDCGDMPQLSNIVENGTMGNLASFPPYLSPMLWNTISTGKHPHRHGICGFSEVDERTGKVRAISSRSRKCKAIWNILTEQGRECHVLGWFASHPAEAINGICVSEAFARPSGKIGGDWPVPKASVYPSREAGELSELRVAPEAIDHALLDFLVPLHREIKPPKGARVDQLLVRLAELYTIHNAAVGILQCKKEFDFLGVYYHFIDWISHDFMEFHPPRRDHIDEERYNWFKNVVARAYQLQDILLRDLLSHAGPEVTVIVVSDHGFQSDHLRPVVTPNVVAGIAAWHRPYGILASAGPGIRRDSVIHGASLADITPSILHYLGLPVGRDMDGRVLTGLFSERRKPEYIDSWETHPPAVPLPAPLEESWGKDDEAALLKQFEELGYVDAESVHSATAAEQTRSQNAWNLGVALRSARREADALPYLEEAYFHAPEQAHVANQVAHCQLALGLLDAAEETIQTILDYGDDRPRANLLMASIEHQRGHLEIAWERLEQAENLEEGRGLLMLRRGSVLISLEEFPRALEAFDRALQSNPDEPRAHLGRAQTLLHLNRLDEASEAARQAIALEHDMIQAHLALAMISEERQEWLEAMESYQRALQIDPGDKIIMYRLTELAARDAPGYKEDQFIREKQFRHMLQQEQSKTVEQIQRLKKASARRFATWKTTRDAQRDKKRPIDSLRPAQVSDPGSSGQTFLIVSGLPRSGTSLMMKMLHAGGVEPMTDSQRQADEHNPDGYYEWEAIKQLPQKPNIIEQAAGKAVKVISLLLPALPNEHHYKVIFMDRPISEVSQSQSIMLAAGDRECLSIDDTLQALTQHKSMIDEVIDNSPQFECLRISYHDLVLGNTQSVVSRIAAFIGEEQLPNAKMMESVVKPALYRQRHPSN